NVGCFCCEPFNDWHVFSLSLISVSERNEISLQPRDVGSLLKIRDRLVEPKPLGSLIPPSEIHLPGILNWQTPAGGAGVWGNIFRLGFLPYVAQLSARRDVEPESQIGCKHECKRPGRTAGVSKIYTPIYDNTVYRRLCV